MYHPWQYLLALAGAVVLVLTPGEALAARGQAAPSPVSTSPVSTNPQAPNATPPSYQWPEAHQNPMLTGVSLDPSINTANASSLGVRWMSYTGSEVLSSPVVAWNAALQETLVFVGNDAGYLTAYDQATGVPVWSVNLGSPIRSTPLVDGPDLWTAPTTGGRAYQLNAATGGVVCSASIQNATGETIDASPVIATPPGGQPTVYVAENDAASANGPVTAINAANCVVDFSSTPEPRPGVGGVWDFLSYGVSATGEGLVFFGTSDPDSAVYAINAITGQAVWRFQTSNPAPHIFDVGAGLTVSPPGTNGLAGGAVYFANKYGIMYAVDLTTGTEIWEYNFGAATGLNPPGSLDTAALSGSDLVFGDSGGLWDLDAITGTERWYHSNGPGGEVDGAAAIIGPSGQQVVVASDLAGSMVVLSLADGSPLYAFQTGAFSVGSPADTDGNILDVSGNGFVYDFAPGAGPGGAPATAVSLPANQSTIANPNGPVTVSGRASATGPISAVTVSIQRNGAGGTWWDAASGSWVASPYPNQAKLNAPGSLSTSWTATFPVPPAGGAFEVFASAVSHGVADPSIGLSPPTLARSSFTVSPSTTATRFVAPVPWVGPGGAVQVRGSGFAADEAVTVSLDGVALKTLDASSSGTVAPANVVLPLNSPFGPAALDASGATSGRFGVAPIYVTNSWSQIGANALHQGADPNDTVLSVHLSVSPQTFLAQAWSFNAGSPVAGSVAVSDGLGFFADQAGEVVALNMATGMPAWTFALPGHPSVDTTPAVTQTSLVLVAALDGTVTALHEFSGALAWRATVGGQLEGSPALVGGAVYVGSDNGTVTALDASTGSTLWSDHLGSAVQGAAAIDPTAGLVIVGDSQGTVRALHVTDGTTAWQTSIPGPVTAATVIGQGRVYVGSLNGTLYALNEQTGASEWTYTAGGPISASVADVAGQLVVGSGDGVIHYLAPATGKPIYAITVGQPVVGVAGTTNFVVSLGAGGEILGSKPASSDPQAWVTTQGTALLSQPTVVDGEVIVAGDNGLVDVYTVPGSPAH